MMASVIISREGEAIAPSMTITAEVNYSRENLPSAIPVI
jgi:hypothetical protein